MKLKETYERYENYTQVELGMMSGLTEVQPSRARYDVRFERGAKKIDCDHGPNESQKKVHINFLSNCQ